MDWTMRTDWMATEISDPHADVILWGYLYIGVYSIVQQLLKN